ncbi:MAG: hypothetical protein AVDCRST_MAG41-3990, partial [uncultured Corynebacteriales bacterium]
EGARDRAARARPGGDRLHRCRGPPGAGHPAGRQRRRAGRLPGAGPADHGVGGPAGPGAALPRCRRDRAAQPAHRDADRGQPLGQLVPAVPGRAAGLRPAGAGRRVPAARARGRLARLDRQRGGLRRRGRPAVPVPGGPDRRPRPGPAPGRPAGHRAGPGGRLDRAGPPGARADRHDAARAGPGRARHRCL